MKYQASLSKRIIFLLLLVVLAIVLSAVSGCSAKQESGWGELEETVPPSGCTILRKKIEEENKKNGTKKVAKC